MIVVIHVKNPEKNNGMISNKFDWIQMNFCIKKIETITILHICHISYVQ